jgi:hypothetical protein
MPTEHTTSPSTSLTVSQILAIGQFATQYHSSAYLSKGPSLSTLNNVSQAGTILFFLTLYASKGAAIALMSRFASGRHILAVYLTFGFTILLGIISVLLLNIDCGWTDFFWHIERDPGSCPSQYLRWQVTTAFDIITEICILLVPIASIWRLQMRTTRKLNVLSRFWIRCP